MTEHEMELNEQGQARRRFLKQAGAAAWAAPFIVTMMSRTAQAGHSAVCGTQALDANPPFSVFCELNATPCGSAHACVPDPTDPGPGNNCICVSA